MRRLLLAVVLATLGALVAPPAAPANATTTGSAPSAASGAAAVQGDRGARPGTIALPDGFQPEGITSRGATFYAGSLANGAIFRGDARTGRGSVLVPGATGRVAVGLDYDRRRNRLWVAGGPTGTVTAYDATSGRLLATYRLPGAGFLNDVVVTRSGVYVTDSGRPQLAVVPLGRGGRLPRPQAVRALPLTGDFSFVPDAFNANGIEAARGGRVLVIVQTATGQLFRVDPRTGRTRRIAVTGGPLTFGDGIELRGRFLYVVRNRLNRVDVVRLRPGLAAGRVVRTLTDAGLDVPTTGTFIRGRLYVVNARFGTPPTPATRYVVTRLPRR